MSNTLHLNLKRKWFDMILSGQKKEEYRELKPYWDNRLVNWTDDRGTLKSFDTITFSNGYSKNRDQFVIECSSLCVREGNPKWGATKGQDYYVIELGNIITK